MEKNSNTSNGVSLSTVVFVVFLILKLTKVIDWSWLWVTSPLWIPLGIVLIILAIIGLVLLLSLVSK
jgi:uncharacterized protein (DUF983 family)